MMFIKKYIPQIFLLVVLIFLNFNFLVLCEDWSFQNNTMIFENSFNTWTVEWNLLDNLKSYESIQFTSVLDEEIHDFNNFSFECAKNNEIDELSFETVKSDEILKEDLFEIENEDYSVLNFFEE